MGCELCSSSKKLRGLSARAQARRISISISIYAAVLLEQSLQRTPSPLCGLASWPPSNGNLYRHLPRSGQGGVGLGQVGGCGSRGHLGFFKFAPLVPAIAKSNRGYFDVGSTQMEIDFKKKM